MTSTGLLPAAVECISERVAEAVREGLASHPKRLPPWLFYDETGSQLFEQITELDEYYLTRTERSIFETHAGVMIARAAAGDRLRIAELGAGSADKTRLLLAAAARRQGPVAYEPMDVSHTALIAACERIERELPRVQVAPLVVDYTLGMGLLPASRGERRLVLYIGSSIGNFEPDEAARLLSNVRASLRPGDALLLGVDLVKDESVLLAAYDDRAGVTAAFNRNVLVRLNRELGADFNSDAFKHRAIWNAACSRIEMHLQSCTTQTVRLSDLEMSVAFGSGETIHTENSYKYRPGKAEKMLARAGFSTNATWTDERGWFAVILGRAE